MCYSYYMDQRFEYADRRFSYGQFRRAAGLSKKEADNWVKAGVVQAGPVNGHRREYRYESIFEGIIAKQLADFSSRELLPKTMAALRTSLQQEGIEITRIPNQPGGRRRLIRIYTRVSKEIMAGGGVRGVITYVGLYDPSSKATGKSVFVVVDLTLVAEEAIAAICQLPPS